MASGCGSGIAAIGSAADSGNGDSNASTVPVVLDVTSVGGSGRPLTSPAAVRLRLSDNEGDPADVELLFSSPALPGLRPITLTSGSASISSVPSNVEYVVEWDFASDVGDESFRDDVTLVLRVRGTNSALTASAVELGNDAPVAESTRFLPESETEFSGSTIVGVSLSDSSADVLALKLEYNADELGGFPESGWFLARPAGTPSTEPTPEFGLTGVATGPGVTEALFVWDSEFDLEGVDQSVRLRATPFDAGLVGAPQETMTVRLDNNDTPRVRLDPTNLLINGDGRNGIPIHFIAFDDESDELGMILQWTKLGEPFIPLPEDVSRLRALLQDPALDAERRALRIGRESPRVFQGLVGPSVGPKKGDQLRLPEVAGTMAGLMSFPLPGREIELLRPASTLVHQDWSSSPVQGAVDAVPLGTGDRAITLDRMGDSWRLAEVRLFDGSILRTIATGTGVPRALGTLPIMGSADPEWLYVAGGTKLQRVHIATGQIDGVYDSVDVAGVRAIAATGSKVLVAAHDSGLVSFDLDRQTTATLADTSSIDDPRGVAVDPLDWERIYVSERGRDRVVSFSTRTRATEPVNATVGADDLGQLGAVAFPDPGPIALARNGARLLVSCSNLSGARAVRGFDMRATASTGSILDGVSRVYELGGSVQDPSAGLRSDGAGVVLVSLPAASTVAAAGGVSRVVQFDGMAPWDPATQTANLSARLEAPVAPGTRWRVRGFVSSRAPSSPDGSSRAITWDSSEVSGGGLVDLRLLPFDRDLGTADVTSIPLLTTSEYSTSTITLDGNSLSFFGNMRACDIDGDQDLDLVTIGFSDPKEVLVALRQNSRGEFDPAEAINTVGGALPHFTDVAFDIDGDGRQEIIGSRSSVGIVIVDFNDFGTAATVNVIGPGNWASSILEVADWNGDGLTDILAQTSNQNPGRIVVFEQDALGGFPTTPRDLIEVTNDEFAYSVGDVDGDGDLDLLARSSTSGIQLIVFERNASGELVRTPPLVTDERILQPQLVDIDRDGRLDAWYRREVDSILTFKVAFRNVFGLLYDFVSVANEPLSPFTDTEAQFVDFDRDGRIELVRNHGGLSGAQQEPARSFEPFTPLSTAQVLGRFADLNGDGRLEFFTHQEVLSPNGTGFEQDHTDEFFGMNDSLPTLTSGDIDADGDVDLIATTAGGVVIFEQIVPGQFLEPPTPVTDASITTPEYVVTHDVDGDGALDLVIAGKDSHNVTIFLGGGDDWTSAPMVTVDHPQLQSPDSLALGDLNGDGRQDLVVASSLASTVAVFLQSTDGTFVEAPTILTDPMLLLPSAVVTGHFDSDDRLDIAVASPGSGRLAIFHQGDGGSFKNLQLFNDTPFIGMTSLSVADVNGDGRTDLHYSMTAGAYVFEQDSVGGFTDRMIPLTFVSSVRSGSNASGPSSTACFDYDSDGDLDIAVWGGGAFNSLGLLQHFTQSAMGRFNPVGSAFSPETALNFSFDGLAAGDFDGDGAVDVAYPFSTNGIRIHYGGR